MKILKSRYKNIESIVLENEILRVEIVPGCGARTASMIYKPDNLELLWQNPAVEHASLHYAMPFGDGEGAGFDEMLPTINECEYPDYPWKGVKMPDHGEVWALPWDFGLQDDSAEFEVNGVRLPYVFSKRLFLDAGVLRARYSLHNRSPFRMPFLYAAHPLFNVSEGDRMIVPETLTSVINSVPSKLLPDYGREYPWPGTCDTGGGAVSGQAADLSVMPASDPGGFRKFYFSSRNDEGWCILRRQSIGIDIRMDYSSDALPWLGIWMNQGGWDGQYNLAPEPASASMDDLNAAREFGCESFLEPGESIEWNLDIGISPSL